MEPSIAIYRSRGEMSKRLASQRHLAPARANPAPRKRKRKPRGSESIDISYISYQYYLSWSTLHEQWKKRGDRERMNTKKKKKKKKWGSKRKARRGEGVQRSSQKCIETINTADN